MTIIGIPFGIQHLKLAGCALAPIGKTVVPVEVAAETRRRNAGLAVSQFRHGLARVVLLKSGARFE